MDKLNELIGRLDLNVLDKVGIGYVKLSCEPCTSGIAMKLEYEYTGRDTTETNCLNKGKVSLHEISLIEETLRLLSSLTINDTINIDTNGIISKRIYTYNGNDIEIMRRKKEKLSDELSVIRRQLKNLEYQRKYEDCIELRDKYNKIEDSKFDLADEIKHAEYTIQTEIELDVIKKELNNFTLACDVTKFHEYLNSKLKTGTFSQKPILEEYHDLTDLENYKTALAQYNIQIDEFNRNKDFNAKIEDLRENFHKYINYIDFANKKIGRNHTN